MGTLARTDIVLCRIPWISYIGALRADATTSNDTQANASLPGAALSANVRPSSAGGRAVGLNTAASNVCKRYRWAGRAV